MTEDQYRELCVRVTNLVREFSLQEALEPAETAEAVSQFLSDVWVVSNAVAEEPEVSDEVKCCPECEKPNQFGELCNDCRRAIEQESVHE